MFFFFNSLFIYFFFTDSFFYFLNHHLWLTMNCKTIFRNLLDCFLSPLICIINYEPLESQIEVMIWVSLF